MQFRLHSGIKSLERAVVSASPIGEHPNYLLQDRGSPHIACFDAPNANTVEQLLHHAVCEEKIWRVLAAISALPDGNTFVRVPKQGRHWPGCYNTNSKIQKGMTPMNTLIKFSDALCHPVSAQRPTWPRGGFANTTREQLAEIGRAFARGDKRTVDQAYEELKATSLRRLRKTVSRNSSLNSWKEMKTLMSQHIFNSNICRILFATCLSASCLIALSTQAATITVTNTNDSGAGSLRQAIADANDGDTIDFGVTGTITLTTGQLPVEKSITIQRSRVRSNLAVDGNHARRAFYIGWGRTVTISGLSIINGYAVDGGGIWNNHGTLTINNSTLSGNSATAFGGGIYNFGDYGSAILTINNSTLSGNSTDSIGGGICNHGFAGSATLTINNSTLSGNSANSGAGIYNRGFSGSVTLTISNSTLSSNSASSVGGGIVNDGTSSGSATLSIRNSTLSGNSSTYSGGGIYNYGHSGNATLEIGNTILKTGASGENIFNVEGTVTSDGYNLSSDNAGGFLTVTGDQITTDPILGPLQDNGGPTLTHAPSQGSPAIDAGDPNFTPPPDYDQRGPGYNRVADGPTDIGAVERADSYAQLCRTGSAAH